MIIWIMISHTNERTVSFINVLKSYQKYIGLFHISAHVNDFFILFQQSTYFSRFVKHLFTIQTF